jgi:hypothetical protein
MRIGKFEEEWESLKRRCENGAFDYTDSSRSVIEIINAHFHDVRSKKKYGVYVVRQSGTIVQHGRFKGQDILARLKNTKGKVASVHWFASLVEEKGPLVFEYAFFAPTPESPALTEAVLLQAYLNEHGCLPYRNKAF